jgi:hypothetical protein
MDNAKENGEKIMKLWKKDIVNNEMIWKMVKKSRLNWKDGRKLSWNVKWYGKYGKSKSNMKRYGQYGRKSSWTVKRYEKYGRNPSWIMKRYGKYRTK